jgi:serine/threonine protein phosphatase PrpC
MGIAQLARKFGHALLPVRISVSGLTVSQWDLEDSFRPRIPPPRSIEGLSRQAMLELEFVERTDVGRVREHNEDYLGHVSPATPAQARTHGWLFVLADGVGGHEQGEVASKAAVESMVGGFQKSKDGEAHTALLSRLVQQANTAVLDAAQAGGRAAAGMATTMVTCALRFDRVTVAHVGDSRCYLIRNAEAVQITRDHTVANEQIRMGLVSEQEADEASTRHILSRSLGSELFANVETNDHQVFPGDVLLLCSDGLHGLVDASEMGDLCGHGLDLQTAAEKLVSLANSRGGNDNISVLLVRIRDVERMGMYRGRPYKLY